MNTTATERLDLLFGYKGDVNEQDVPTKYTPFEEENLLEEVSKLSELVGIIFNTIGVPIRDSDGRLRDTNDVYKDIYYMNQKIDLTFQELMQFEGGE